MKRFAAYFIFSLALLAAGLSLPFALSVDGKPDREEQEKKPNDWLFQQRAYPYGRINYEAFRTAQRQAGALRVAAKRNLNAAEWMPAGPSNIGGRVTSLDIHPSDTLTIYAGTAAGGIFKTTDGGSSWNPIFDEQGSLAIGDVAIDPKNADVIYAGTGEANLSSLCYPGNGIYKSTDGGESWRHLGLDSTRYIGKIIVDPFDSRRVYALAMGEQLDRNTSRGLYRSQDAGESWERIFFLNDSTGCIDMAIHPNDPNILFITTWERTGVPASRTVGGPGSGIYRSGNAGSSWTKIAGGFPGGSLGRIGIAIAPSDPNRMYAIVADTIGEFGGIYRSDNGGNSWKRTADSGIHYFFFSNFGWWFGRIYVDPRDPDLVYGLGIDTWRSTDGGKEWMNFNSNGEVHSDQHDLYIHPGNPNFMVAGNDGGIFTSYNKGANWTHAKNFPATQFYTCEVDYQYPYRLYGGTQDNNTIRTLTGRNDDWYPILGGDGFVVRIDPADNQYVYAEMQNGSFYRSIDGGESMQYAMEGIAFDDYEDRFNWNTPFTFDPSDTKTLYIGSQRIYRSVDRAENWFPISPDLTKSPQEWGGVGGTLTTIAVAPSDPAVIYAGCNDGNVWVTLNRGVNWTQINGGLPQRWITRVAVDPADARTAYVTFSGFRYLDYQPHIMKTTDAGRTWIDISGNLPEAPINEVVIDPRNRKVLFIASDVGVYYTENGGESWLPLGVGLPNVPVLDLEIHAPTRKLIAATFGRSMFTIDISSVARADEEPAGESVVAAIASSPIPFSLSSTVRFTLPSAGNGELDVYDLAGRHVRRLVQGRMEAGEQSYIWDGRRDDGSRAAPGGYVYRLHAGDALLVGKTVLQ